MDTLLSQLIWSSAHEIGSVLNTVVVVGPRHHPPSPQEINNSLDKTMEWSGYQLQQSYRRPLAIGNNKINS